MGTAAGTSKSMETDSDDRREGRMGTAAGTSKETDSDEVREAKQELAEVEEKIKEYLQ